MKRSRTRKRKQKAKIIAKTVVTISPFVLIFALGTNAIVNYLNREAEAQDQYDDLANQIVVEQTVETTTTEPTTEIEEAPTEPIILPDPVEVYSTDLLDQGYEFKEINFDELNGINEDAVAWVEIDDTIIDYPIVQGTDNEYYLHHDIYGSTSSTGVIFQDVRSNPFGSEELSDFSVLYGHHMRTGTMFASICNYKDPNYVNSHPYAVIYAEDGSVYEAEFFAGQVISGDTDEGFYMYGFESDTEFDNYIEGLKNNSTFNTDVELEYGDKIICFITCSYETNNSRYALYAKLTRQYTNYEDYESAIEYNESIGTSYQR